MRSRACTEAHVRDDGAMHPGDTVRIAAGRMEGFSGRVDVLEADAATARVLVRLFGRETPVQVPLSELVIVEGATKVAVDEARRDPTAILDEG